MLKNTKIIKWHETNEYVTHILNEDKAIFLSRIGGSDTSAIRQYFYNRNIINDEEWYYKYSNIVKMYNGYFDFDNSKEKFQLFLEDMMTYYKNSDDIFYCGQYIIDDKSDFFDYILDNKTIINYSFIEGVTPFLNSLQNWIKNKKILIVSPFSRSIEYQFKNKDKLYLDYKFPDFELKTYNTKITYNTDDDTKESLGLTTNNWHEECVRMSEEIRNIDFDIALLSCASYSMFLGDYIKNKMNKKAIYLGGILNVYFNIYGGRYNDDYYKKCGLNLEYQIDPFENDDIINIKGGKDKNSEAINAYFGKRNNNK